MNTAHQFSKRLWEMLLLLSLLLSGTTTFVSCSNEDNPPAEWVLPDIEAYYLTAADRRENLSAAESAKYDGYAWRLEAKNDKEEMPDNFRWCGADFNFEHEFAKKMPDPSYVPTRQGLDGLRISGSARFNAKQLTKLTEWLREKAGNSPIYIVDMRNESHGIVNGHHMSWYGLQNWSNIGMTTEEILRDEQNRIDSIKGLTILYGRMRARSNFVMTDSTYEVVRPSETMTEREAVEAKGLRYHRITALDHTFPRDGILDDFLAFYRSLPQDCWLHFHCQAGHGRTTLYMALIDMLRNPDVPLKDILHRVCLIGGTSLYDDGTGHPEWRVDLFRETSRMVPLLYQYVQENKANGYSVKWSDWKKRRYKLF